MFRFVDEDVDDSNKVKKKNKRNKQELMSNVNYFLLVCYRNIQVLLFDVTTIRLRQSKLPGIY